MSERNISTIRLIEPDLCLECRFSQMVDLQLEDGSTERSIFCRRGDCDNWDRTQSRQVRVVNFDLDT